MAITNLTVSNFKSFKQLDLALGRFNVVIGANASGKSNLVEIFKFLRTIEKENLDDAISLHGGPDSILNKKLGPSEPLRMRAVSDRQTDWGGAWPNIRVYETAYDFCLQLKAVQNGALIKDDHFTQKLRTGTGDEAMELKVDILTSEGKRRLEIGPQHVIDRFDGLSEDPGTLPLAYQYMRGLEPAVEMSKTNALLVRTKFFGFIEPSDSLFGNIGVYNIDPRAAKKPHERAGIPRLQEGAENLSLVLKQILADPEKNRMLHNLLRDILSFAVEIGTEHYLGNSILLKLREKYYEDELLANLLSDGTVDIVALITALYFEDKDVIIIEEPERNIHPHLISRLVGMMKDASRKKKDASRDKQIIVTTHSPEIVRHAGVENLLLLTRDKDGFSTISRPADKEEVRIFLENDLGIDEVFVQELWGMR